MYNQELVIDILRQIDGAITKVIYRSSSINSPNEFLESENGMEKLDAICMQLIAIGESVKNLDKITNKTLFIDYNSVDWKGVKGMRDIITHHYFDIDAETIFNVCLDYIPELQRSIQQIICDIENK